MICRECGARIEDDAAECKFCGAVYGAEQPVSEQPVPEEPVQTEQTEPVVEETYGVTPEKDEIDELFDENEEKRRAQMEKIRMEKQAQIEEIEKRRKVRKRKQRRNILLIILLVLLLGGAVAAGIYYISPSYTGDVDGDVVIVTQEPTWTPEITREPVEETPLPEETPEATEDITPIPEDDMSDTENVISYSTPKPVVTKAPVVEQKPVVTKKPVATKAPVVTQKPVATKAPAKKSYDFNSALVVGGEIIKADGKTYMSYTYDGAVYYAIVSDNTTTNFIAGKPMTLSAYKSAETYNGNPVYEIAKITHYNGSYIIQNSGTQLLTTADLQGKTAEQLRVARNEIFARHGRTFTDASLKAYFESCSWYKPKSTYNYANENSNLNWIEKQNVTTIKAYEDSIK